MALLHLANATALNFEFTEDEKKNLALAFERVLRELNRRERCLLILDNGSVSRLPKLLETAGMKIVRQETALVAPSASA